jgi:uncharacterized protein YcfJ
MQRVAMILPCLLALASSAATAREPSANTSYGYAQVLRVEPVYEVRTVQTVDPECLRPGGRVIRVPADCKPQPQQVRRIVAYDVEYTYKGDTYMSRLDSDPGNRVRVRVSVTPVTGRGPEPVAPAQTR